MSGWQALQEGGPIMPIILIAALAGYVLAIERLLMWGYWTILDRPLDPAQGGDRLRQQLARPGSRATPLAYLLRRGLEISAEDSGGLPPAEMEAAVQVEILSRMPEINARIATIGWLGGILPMLGLLGTVSGMIATFHELANTTSRQVLSQGLSEALWTTEVGLLGALPLLAAHHLLTRLKARWLDRLELSLALLQQSPPLEAKAAQGRRRATVAKPQSENSPGRRKSPVNRGPSVRRGRSVRGDAHEA